MSRTLVYRQNRLFKIDTEQLPKKANNTAVINNLYADIYTEFSGANENSKYSNMTYLQRIEAVNAFALKWLEDRGLNK